MSMTGFIISFLIWAIFHSITAAQSFKDRVARLVGDRMYQGFYRLFYSAVSVITLLPVLYFYWQLPDQPLWQVSAPFSWLMFGLQAAGFIGLTLSVLQSGALSFVGVQQAADYFSGNAISRQSGLGEVLVVHGLYRYMRHPLYTFSMLLLWASPSMSRNSLILTLLISAYFVIGSFIEERRLELDFGEAYVDYRKRVSRFVPYVW
jgi:protein-S-isoprenylcysteine O-methyltransferase Ste14